MSLKTDYNSGGFWQQTGSAVFDALEGIANWLGLGRFVRRTTRKAANAISKEDLYTEAELQNIISKLVTRAQAMGSIKLTELSNKLAQLPVASSPTLKGFVSSAIESLKQQIRDQNARNAEIDVAAAKAASYLADHASQTSGDIVSGKMKETQNSAINAAKQAFDIANDVEEKVSK